MFRTPAQPSLAPSTVLQALCAPRRGGVTLVLGAALAILMPASACVFVPPPLLPEETAALEASKAARKAARAAAPGPASAAGDGDAAAGPELTFKKGDEAPRGMNAAQLRAYNAAQGDPEASEFKIGRASCRARV